MGQLGEETFCWKSHQTEIKHIEDPFITSRILLSNTHRWNIFELLLIFLNCVSLKCPLSKSIGPQGAKAAPSSGYLYMLMWKPPKIMWPCTKTMKLKLAKILCFKGMTGGRRVIEQILLILKWFSRAIRNFSWTKCMCGWVLDTCWGGWQCQ